MQDESERCLAMCGRILKFGLMSVSIVLFGDLVVEIGFGFVGLTKAMRLWSLSVMYGDFILARFKTCLQHTLILSAHISAHAIVFSHNLR